MVCDQFINSAGAFLELCCVNQAAEHSGGGGALLGWTHETCSSAIANDELESILRSADGTCLAADLAQSCNELVGAIQWEAQHNPTFTDEAIQVCLRINCLFNSPLRQAMEMT